MSALDENVDLSLPSSGMVSQSQTGPKDGPKGRPLRVLHYPCRGSICSKSKSTFQYDWVVDGCKV